VDVLVLFLKSSTSLFTHISCWFTLGILDIAWLRRGFWMYNVSPYYDSRFYRLYYKVIFLIDVIIHPVPLSSTINHMTIDLYICKSSIKYVTFCCKVGLSDLSSFTSLSTSIISFTSIGFYVCVIVGVFSSTI